MEIGESNIAGLLLPSLHWQITFYTALCPLRCSAFCASFYTSHNLLLMKVFLALLCVYNSCKILLAEYSVNVIIKNSSTVVGGHMRKTISKCNKIITTSMMTSWHDDLVTYTVCKMGHDVQNWSVAAFFGDSASSCVLRSLLFYDTTERDVASSCVAVNTARDLVQSLTKWQPTHCKR